MASGIVLMKRWGSPVPMLAMTSWQLIAGGLVLVPLALLMEGLPSTVTLPNIAGFLWLGVVGTGMAYSLWFRGVGRLPVARVSLLGLLSPVVAITLGWVIAGQAMTPVQLWAWVSCWRRCSWGRPAVGRAVAAPQRAPSLERAVVPGPARP